MKIKYWLCITALVAVTLNGYSDIAVSNLDNQQDWEEIILPPLGDGTTDEAFTGNSFTTGSNEGGYTVESITLQFGVSTNIGGNFELYLCPDNAGTPDKNNQLLLLGPADPGVNALETYVISGGYGVTADTTYWIVATSDVEGTAWVSTEDLTVSGESGWDIGSTAYLNSADYSISGTPDPPTAQMFAVNIQAIPEPATVSLIALFGVGTLACKRLFS